MKRVELLGCGLSLGEGPQFDPTVEYWGVNRLMFTRYSGEVPRWTRWFDLHSTAHIQRYRPDAYAWYCEQTHPIYRWEPDPQMVTAVYPQQKIQEYFAQDGVLERDFWGSLSWMLALAIYERFEQIDLWWFPLDQEQYGMQLGSARYWIGQARARGIRVTVHGDSALLANGPLYGLETCA